MLKALKWLIALVVLALAGIAGWLTVAPPDLIRVGTAYSAKVVCSNVFIAGRDADQVMADDVQAPGHWLLKYMSVDVDRNAKTAAVSLLGLFGESVALARDGLGCTSVPSGELYRVAAATLPARPGPAAGSVWPDGERVDPSQDPDIAKILDDPGLTGPGMRAIVVVKDGRIVGERYGERFTAETPLLGWSMTKSVTAGIIGTLVKSGKMKLESKGLFEPWKADGRAEITLADLMAMSSGLEFNEDYGAVADVTRMLFLQPDMAGFAWTKPLAGEVGKVFSYSSGTTVMLSRLWQQAAGEGAALAWPGQALFGPLGMSSAVMETDEAGTYVGSSYLYASGRDWARYGQFLLQKGVWKGQEILPPGFVDWMAEPAPASNRLYGRGQVWMQGPGDDETAEHALGVPVDAFWMLGHDGQSTAIIPSKQMVVVRLGLTPSKLGYRSEPMVGALVKALD